MAIYRRQTKDDLPRQLPIKGNGTFPLCAVAQWLATRRGRLMDLSANDPDTWREAASLIMSAAADGRIAIFGRLAAPREGEPLTQQIESRYFAACDVAYPSQPSEEAYLEDGAGKSCIRFELYGWPPEGKELDADLFEGYQIEWEENGFNDALWQLRSPVFTHLTILGDDARRLYQMLPEKRPRGPTIKALVIPELERRAKNNEMLLDLRAEARALAAWVQATHGRTASPETVRKHIRAPHDDLQRGPK